ncbi:hypothetical protein BGZ91_006992 [Linnemannia elongata]|nr:hypothetical protein BGZ91_006992 [Linnemannia elongata]
MHIFGVGLSLLPIQITAVRDAENKDQGLVGALYNTGLQLGAPFGLAILNVISISTNGNTGGAVRGGPAMAKGFHNAFYAMIAMGLFGFLLAFVILPWDKPVRPTAATAHKNDSTPSLASTAVPANSASTIEPKDLEEVISFSEVAGHASERHDSDASTIASQTDDIEKGHLQV